MNGEDLPPGWCQARIGDLVELAPKTHEADNLEAGFVPLQRLGVTYRGRHTFEPRPWGEIKKAYTHFQNGDVLLARITPSFENGKAGIARDLPNGIGAGSSEYFVCRPYGGAVLPEFLLAYFKTRDFLRDGEQVMSGAVGQQRVPKQFVLERKIPFAPLNEQKRIADKLDALLARVDACRERLDRIPGILKRFRQSVLAAATSGELTADWREERGLEMDWVPSTVKDIADVGTGSTPLRSNAELYAPSGVPWVTSAATSEPFVYSAREFVTDEAVRSHRLRKYPVGTLLVAMYGEGKTRGQVSELAIEATINQACAAIQPEPSRVETGFLKLVLQANYLEMRELAEGGNQPNLNLSKIKNFPLLLPSTEEQREVCLRAHKLLGTLDRTESAYTRGFRHASEIIAASLAKAFRGELVEQDPNDEPASVLLERIRAGRAAETNAGRTGKRNGRRFEVLDEVDAPDPAVAEAAVGEG
ncbi:MAG: restriction endonuclease subunit S [Dehalococcoidia bacterium]